MHIKKFIMPALVCILLLTACKEYFGIKRRPVSITKIVINHEVRYQVMRGFAASDAWCGNFVGQFWSDSAKKQVADWLFSQEFDDDGNPRGIGLSMWRFNLGAGTAEQGSGSGISDETRRAECFMDESENYNWDKHAGQQYFLREAKKAGCESFVAFSNSPPVQYTLNGRGYAPGGKSANLRNDCYDKFAEYMAEVALYFKETAGIEFDYISPINEPQYAWTGNGQEGSPWKNEQIKTLVMELDKSINKRGLAAKILIPEAANWTYLYESGKTTGYDDQIAEFFNTGSPNYIGSLSSVVHAAASHSYFTYRTNQRIIETREEARKKADEYGIELFQTEWSLLDESGEGITQNADNTTYWENGLFLGKMIYSDLAYAGVTSWSYWTAMDKNPYQGHKDRFLLIALAPGVKEFDETSANRYSMRETGAVKDCPTLWVLGNYSRFVRPGFTRISVDGADDLNGLMGAAFISPDNNQIIAVYVNMGSASYELEAVFKNRRHPAVLRRYLTDEYNNLSFIPSSDFKYVIPPRSVYTTVYDF